MGFPRLGAAFNTKTAYECTQSELNDVRHAQDVVSECGPLDSGGLTGSLYLASHRVI